MTDAQAAFADEGTGPALVLVAEPGRGIEYLAPLAHSLATEDFRIVRIEADGPQGVVAVLDELGIEHAWVGGHGAGGTVARAVALAHHDRVNGVMLFGVEAGGGQPAEGIPVLVIQADGDEVTPPANGEALQAQAPGLVSLVAVEGAGHDFPATHVGATSWAIEDYLDWD